VNAQEQHSGDRGGERAVGLAECLEPVLRETLREDRQEGRDLRGREEEFERVDDESLDRFGSERAGELVLEVRGHLAYPVLLVDGECVEA